MKDEYHSLLEYDDVINPKPKGYNVASGSFRAERTENVVVQ